MKEFIETATATSGTRGLAVRFGRNLEGRSSKSYGARPQVHGYGSPGILPHGGEHRTEPMASAFSSSATSLGLLVEQAALTGWYEVMKSFGYTMVLRKHRMCTYNCTVYFSYAVAHDLQSWA